ncbi:MAG: hypothetical protein AB8B65_00465 [Kordia sp.]|uniref:hypothetical protein n=1 Tax=Kordia sp. TaxID=1965332 RepID=UPI00385DF7BD
MCAAIVSCSTDEDATEEITEANEQENLMLGNWKLMYIYTPFSTNQTTDYSAESINYEFLEDGIVVVSNDNLIHDAGTYNYTFTLEEREDIDGNGNPIMTETLVATIDNGAFSYLERTDGLIRLIMSESDGQDLLLQPIE